MWLKFQEKIKYSKEINEYDNTLNFTEMNISRPILKVC